MNLILLRHTGTTIFACDIFNPIAGAGSFFTFCLNAFLLLFYFFAGFRRNLSAGAFSIEGGSGFSPDAGLSGCRTFCLNTFLFLYYLFAGQRLSANAFPGGGGSAFHPITGLSGRRAFVLNAFLFL
jgi:hypothetical protein